MDFDVFQHCSHIVRGIVLKLLKVGEFLDGSTATVDVVVFGQLPGQNFCRSSQPPIVRSLMCA